MSLTVSEKVAKPEVFCFVLCFCFQQKGEEESGFELMSSYQLAVVLPLDQLAPTPQFFNRKESRSQDSNYVVFVPAGCRITAGPPPPLKKKKERKKKRDAYWPRYLLGQFDRLGCAAVACNG